jgi:hypothetical protein
MESQLMKSLLLPALFAALLSQAAAAETFKLPNDNPAVIVTLPDAWSPQEDDGWVEATSNDEEMFVAFEVTGLMDFEESVKETVQYLADEGVKLDTSSENKEAFEINGMKGMEVAWKGTDKDGDVSVSLSVIAVAPDKILLLTYWSTPKGDKDQAPMLREILKSIRKIES